MPCIFCIAMIAIVGSAVASVISEQLASRLETKASSPVRVTVDSSTVCRLETEFEVGGRRAPVVVTVYKEQGRVRIQILTHELSREEIEELEDLIAELLEAEIVERTTEEDEAPVRRAHGEDHEHDEHQERSTEQNAKAKAGRNPPEKSSMRRST